ncbi:MAG: SCO family protein [Gammaproteobacteria bacterium]|nr:MAG: SCO family protein [Gammaproteobacteria bacterium]
MRGWLALGLFLLLQIAACSPAPKADFKGTDITGADFGRSLNLTDHNGVHRSLEDFRGKVVVLFFGYTHCPDVCPTTLSDVAMALRQLPPEQAARVQVLFVSVDPERDTAEMLSQYVPYFHPDFLGLLGSQDEVAAAAKEFRIVYRKHVEEGATGYLVDHTAGSYMLDAEGNLRLFLPFAQPAPDIAHDLGLLLAEG